MTAKFNDDIYPGTATTFIMSRWGQELNCPGNRGGWLVLIMRLLSIPADYARIVPQTLRVGCDRWVQGDVLG